MIMPVPRRPIATLLAATLLGAAASAAEPPFVLDLPGGGRLPGRFAPASPEEGGRATLPWQAEGFSAPLEFRLDAVVGVRPTGDVAAGEGGEFRCRLRGGDVIDGDLQAIDADGVVLVPPGGRPLRIRRDAVAAIGRRTGVAAGYVGPGGLAGWKQRPESSWREEGGRIASDRDNSMVGRDIDTPRRARYDLVLSWREQPELLVAVGRGFVHPDDPGGFDSFRFEMVSLPEGPPQAMIVRQEEAAGGLEPIDLPADIRGRLRLSLFTDLDKGRLAAVVGGAAPVEMTVPPGENASSQFRLLLRSGDVCLESLRVAEWRSAEPEMDDGEAGGVRLAGDRFVAGTVAALDAETRTLLVKTDAGEERIPLADLEEAILPAGAADDAEPAGGVRVVLGSGGVLTGKLVSVEAERLTVACPAVAEPVPVPLAGLRSLTSLATVEPEPLPGRSGRLVMGQATMMGCVVNADGGGFAWRPTGSVGSSPFAGGGEGAGPAAVVEYVQTQATDGENANQPQLGGMGAAIDQTDEGAFMVTMLSGDGAAAADGRIEPGDEIVAVRPVKGGVMVETKGLDLATVHDLVRGRVGTQVTVRIRKPGNDGVGTITLVRRPIDALEEGALARALATHARMALGRPDDAAQAGGWTALVVLRSGDTVPAAVEAIDEAGVRLRSPVTATAGGEAVVVADGLVKAIELDPSVEGKGISPARFARLLTLPRSQQSNPPTHLLRLRNGDYLRGRLEALDGDEVRFDVLGQKKRLPRAEVVRLIWLHPEDVAKREDAAAEEPPPPAEPARGLLVQGVAASGERTTLVAERVDGLAIVGTSPAFGPARIDTTRIDRLVIGGAVGGGDEELPFSKWKLKPAPIPRALRADDGEG